MRFAVTGANRGIGLELARQIAARGDLVEAAVRDPAGARELMALGDRVRVGACDVRDDASVRAWVASLGDVAIDVLINNAGALGKMQSLEELDMEDVTATFDINALGPIRMTRALLPALRRAPSPKVMHVTSGMGSISGNTDGGAYGYRMSKAALNMANKSMSLDHRDIVFAVINPGWVQTDMGGHGAPTPVVRSVRGILAKLDTLGKTDSGRFLDFEGPDRAY